MKTYTFKHPVTRELVNIVADSLHKALSQLRSLA